MTGMIGTWFMRIWVFMWPMWKKRAKNFLNYKSGLPWKPISFQGTNHGYANCGRKLILIILSDQFTTSATPSISTIPTKKTNGKMGMWMPSGRLILNDLLKPPLQDCMISSAMPTCARNSTIAQARTPAPGISIF